MAIFPNTCDFCIIKLIPYRLELTAKDSNHFAFKPVSETVNLSNMGNSCYCSILLPTIFLKSAQGSYLTLVMSCHVTYNVNYFSYFLTQTSCYHIQKSYALYIFMYLPVLNIAHYFWENFMIWGSVCHMRYKLIQSILINIVATIT